MRDEAPSGIEAVPTLHWGTHICQAFERASDLKDALIPYFTAGLRNNEACLWVTAAPFPAEEARAALRAAVPDLDDRENANQIEICDASAWYEHGQPIEPDTFISDLLRREREALDRGYAGLRTNGNCSWVAPEQRVDFQRYEEHVQRMVKGRRMICMCSYGPHQTREPAFHDVILAHNLLLSPKDRAVGSNAAPVRSAQAREPGDGPVTFEDVLITDQLKQRVAVNGHREKPALDQLVRRVTDQPSAMLPKLVNVALDICDADSAGVSVLERDKFRWVGLCGKLAVFEGAETPRDDSPCGICLDRDAAILMQEPERIYSWIADAKITVPEVLLVPLRAPDGQQIGTLWVVADKGHFNAGHAQTLAELATFTGMSLHMIRTEERLTRALEQERLVAGEMSHRVKNMYAVAASIVKMSAQKASSTREMSDNVIARLSALGRAHRVAESTQSDGVSLQDLLTSVLEPYVNCELSGPPVYLCERALDPLVMTFHELATNALKYGALRASNGRVEVSWTRDDANVALTWRERNGPPPDTPAPLGFGSALIRSSIASLNGTITKSWPSAGLEARIMLPLDVLSEVDVLET